MATTIESKYGSSGQAITITLGGLSNGASRESTAIDNTSNLFLDALAFIAIKTGASGTISTGYAIIYAYGSANGGTNYTQGATGTNAAITLTSPPNVRQIGVINLVADATTYAAGPFSVAAAFGGVLPDHWGIIVTNLCGGAFDGTEGNHIKVYQGVQAQTV